MATQYTQILKLALPVTGELNGTWGDVVNNEITSMVEQAIAGLVTINSWTANSHTLTVADGTSSESRCAILILEDDGGGNPSAPATLICPDETKIYVVKNTTGQTVTVKTASGTGIAVPDGNTITVFCDATNVNQTDSFFGDVLVDDLDITGGVNIDSLTASTALALNGSKDVVSVTNTGTGNNVLATTPVLTGSRVTVSALGTLTTGTTTINLATAQVFTATISSSSTVTIAFSNAPSAGTSEVVLLRLTNAGSGTIIWPANTKFPRKRAAALTVSGVDMLGVYYDVTTGTYMVFVVGLNIGEAV